MKKLILCADDYGISPLVSNAIIELIDLGRLNATSVMVNEITANEVAALKNKSIQIGLHLTLTRSLKPLVLNNFPSIKVLLLKAFSKTLPKNIEQEIEAQFDKFITLFGRAPDYIDGHQHCHVLPLIRQKVLSEIRKKAPNAWIRQTHGAGLGFKARIISFLSNSLHNELNGIKTNLAFSGSYHFNGEIDYRAHFLAFLKNQPDGLLIMVHPGKICDILKSRDTMLKEREIEYAYLKSDEFLVDLKHENFTL